MARAPGGAPGFKGSVRCRGERRYEARWYVPTFDVTTGAATHRRQAKSFPTEQQAYDFLATVQTDKRHGTYLDPAKGELLFSVVAAEWLAVLATQRPKTLNGYDSLLRTHLLPYFGGRTVASITAHDVRKFLAHMSRIGAAAGTVRNAYRVLKPVLDTAVEIRAIPSNPCGPLRRGSLPPASRTQMRALTAEQVDVLAAHTPAPYDTLVLLAAYTGMRAGEIAALQMANVDLLRGRIRVTASISETGGACHVVPPKTGEAREVILPPFLVRRLQRHIEDHPPIWGYLFTGKPAAGLTAAQADTPEAHRLRHRWFYANVFTPATRRAGLAPMRFHDLRHTCASLLIAKNSPMKAISHQLGHSTISITMDLYGHLLPSVEAGIAQALEDTYLHSQTATLRRLA